MNTASCWLSMLVFAPTHLSDGRSGYIQSDDIPPDMAPTVFFVESRSFPEPRRVPTEIMNRLG